MITLDEDTLLKLLSRAYMQGADDNYNQLDTTIFDAKRVAKEILDSPFK